MKNLFIKYISRKDKHVDPNFTFLTYGDSGARGTQIKNTIQPGSYVFFHTSYDKKEYITAYFYVEKILTRDKNKAEIESLNTDSKVDEVVILGSRAFSKVLTCPLQFGQNVAENLKSLNIDWNKVTSEGQSQLKTISDPTRAHREITDQEVEWLLDECKNRG